MPGWGDVLEPTQVDGYPEVQSLRTREAIERPRALFVRDAADRKQFRLVREVHIMAVPKRRMSRSNTRGRRAQWKAVATGLVNVNVAGQAHKVPRRLLKAARLGLIDLDRRA